MSRILFHPLPGQQRAVAVLNEVLRLYEHGKNCVVWVADAQRRTAFDQYLWNYQKLAFIPHSVWDEDMEALSDPIVLLGTPGNPNSSDVLVVADDPPPPDWAESFSEIHEFIPPGEEGETRKQWWLNQLENR